MATKENRVKYETLKKKLEGGNGYENMKHGNGMWCNCLMKVGGTGMC